MAGVAGCTGLAAESGAPDSTPSTGTTTTRTAFSEYGCPPTEFDEKPVVCSHTVDTESASVYLLVSRTPAESETPTLTLHNDSSTELTFNPHSWSIKRKQASGWEPIEKRMSGDGKLTVAPGEIHAWTFEEVVRSINQQVALDPEIYAASITVPDPDSSEWIRCLALVRLT
jgi:hypothetical protein